jgi:hypothetical protein
MHRVEQINPRQGFHVLPSALQSLHAAAGVIRDGNYIELAF